jgi:sec-independent protein translocase protein TatC
MAEDESVPFSSHLDELRKRLIWSAVGVFIAFSLVFALWADDIVNYIQQIAVVKREVDGEIVYEQIKFVVINPLELFGTTMRVSFYAAIAFAYPWMMLQAYFFVAPGLYRHERRFFQMAIPAIFVLFVAGAAFGRYVVMPITIPFLLDFNVEAFDAGQSYSLAQFLALVFAMTFGLGFVFQIPLVVAPLVRFGLLSPDFFKRKRRYVIFASVLIGALISPTASPIDMVLAGAPVFFLVEGGAWLGGFWRRRALRKAEKEALAAAERGEQVDTEALAGGLALDLEKRLAEFSQGGAREFAKELIKGFREGGKDLESIFDDDFDDSAKPPVEVKLKQRKKTEPADAKPDQMHNAKFELESAPAPAGRPGESKQEPPGETKEEHPDRPWDENVNEETARYIEDRISQRLNDLMEKELRPWMERIEHELRRREDEDQT